MIGEFKWPLLQLNVKYHPIELYKSSAQHIVTLSFDEASDRLLQVEAKIDGKSEKSSTMIWIEKLGHNTFGLFLAGARNSSMYVSVTTTDLVDKELLLTEKLNLNVENSPRSIWFEGLDNGPTLYVNESTPIGYVLHRIKANTTYSQETPNIRFFWGWQTRS